MTIMKYKANRPVLRSLLDDFWGTSVFDDTLLDDKKWMPAVNVKETDESFIVELMAPGFNKEDFQVTTENGLLTIAAKVETEDEEKNENYTRREFNFTSFSRSFTLPENIELENINAKYDKGMLVLVLAKTPLPQSKKLQIEIK
jgi:HSP20 family protein